MRRHALANAEAQFWRFAGQRRWKLIPNGALWRLADQPREHRPEFFARGKDMVEPKPCGHVAESDSGQRGSHGAPVDSGAFRGNGVYNGLVFGPALGPALAADYAAERANPRESALNQNRDQSVPANRTFAAAEAKRHS